MLIDKLTSNTSLTNEPCVTNALFSLYTWDSIRPKASRFPYWTFLSPRADQVLQENKTA